MLWYWSLDDDDEEDEIEIKNTKPAPQKSDVYESKVEILTDPDDTNMKLVCLNLNDEHFGDDGVLRLSTYLSSNQSKFTEINLKNNNITNSGAKCICNALSTYTTCTTLNLGRNVIGDEGAIAIASLLKMNRTIEGMALHNNQIGDVGAAAIADALKINSSLIILRLENNCISSGTEKKLKEAWGQRRGRLCL